MENVKEEKKAYMYKNLIDITGSDIIGYFNYYDEMRERSEPPEFLSKIYRFSEFKDKKVLEIGCGNGYILSKYAKAGAECFGVDISEKAVEVSLERFKLERLIAKLKVAEAENLPFEDNSFDLVCSMGVLHYTKDTQKAVKEIHRVLKPGGEAILMFYHKNSAQYRLFFPIQTLLKNKSRHALLNETYNFKMPVNKVYAKSEVKKLMKDFKEVEIKIDFLPAHHFPLVWRFIPDGFFKPFSKWLGFKLYISAEK
ncbi:MAG: class I SAM-dependent methyltransferase [Armatimonadota bacterium]